jgi:hypothetical protein
MNLALPNINLAEPSSCVPNFPKLFILKGYSAKILLRMNFAAGGSGLCPGLLAAEGLAMCTAR